MRWLAVVASFVAAPVVAQEVIFTDVTVTNVVDGDTWDVEARMPTGVMFSARVRPLGFDCAEPRGGTREEGLAQARVLERLLFSAKRHRLTVFGLDSFGRWLVVAMADNTSVSRYMIANGCADA